MASNKMTLRSYVAATWIFKITAIYYLLLRLSNKQSYKFRGEQSIHLSLSSPLSRIQLIPFSSIYFGYFFPLGAPPVPV